MNRTHLQKFQIIMVLMFLTGILTANAQQTIEGLHYITGNPVQVKIENGKIASVKEVKKLNDENAKIYIAPGFFDNQVNGFAGVSFAFGESDLTPEGIKLATSELWKMGVTTYFPTLTTNSQEVLVTNFKLLANAVEDEKLLG
jgi:N-acetylglucosamine-6-phosphate deacetylase